MRRSSTSATASSTLADGKTDIRRRRPHCFDASRTCRSRRARTPSSNLTSERSVSRGMKRRTPSSVSFSRSHFWRSPFGRATSAVTATSGSRSSTIVSRIVSSTRPFAIDAISQRNARPSPAKSVASSPTRLRITRVRCCASAPVNTARLGVVAA